MTEPQNLTEPKVRKPKLEDCATSIVFVAVMLGLLLSSIPRLLDTKNTYSLEEKRKLAALPKLDLSLQSLAQFPRAFEQYLNDRFAFRSQLVTAASLYKYEAFQVSTSAMVVPGDEGWLYFAESNDLATMRHYPLYGSDELHEWARVLEARRRWLAKRNIKYVVVIAPSKCSIYPEYIPPAYAPVSKQSRQNQFFEELKSNTAIRTIDLRPTLLSAKQTSPYKPIYFKTDTHWNLVGGFIGTEKIIDSIKDWFPTLSTIPFTEVKVHNISSMTSGDLAGLLGLSGILTENEAVLVPHGNFSWHESADMKTPDFDDPKHTYDPFATVNLNTKLPKAVAFRDSFFQIARFYMSEHFSRICYYWQLKKFPTDVIEREKPDIVIQEIVERFLVSELPHNPPEVDALCTPEQFAQSLSRTKLAGLTSNSPVK